MNLNCKCLGRGLIHRPGKK